MTSFSVVCVGAGGNGYQTSGSLGFAGGGGGALSYVNYVPVTSSSKIVIAVGAAGTTTLGGSTANGGASYVNVSGTPIVWAGGGTGATSALLGGAGGTATIYGSSVGFSGGSGGFFTTSTSVGSNYGAGAGGGGAAGYAGNGGAGGNSSCGTGTGCSGTLPCSGCTNGQVGTGGGGSGGAGSMVLNNGAGTTLGYWLGPPGGGVGLYGLGTSGALKKANSYANFTYDARSGNNAWWTTYAGSPGSGGSDQTYGGGGGGLNFAAGAAGCPSSTCPYTWAGGAGACRIIWGTGCSFPNNADAGCYVR